MGIQTGTYGGQSELILSPRLAASFPHIVFTSQLLPLCSVLKRKKRKTERHEIEITGRSGVRMYAMHCNFYCFDKLKNLCCLSLQIFVILKSVNYFLVYIYWKKYIGSIKIYLC
jgi:hypothetical protein